jgi:hypothetical protein
MSMCVQMNDCHDYALSQDREPTLFSELVFCCKTFKPLHTIVGDCVGSVAGYLGFEPTSEQQLSRNIQLATTGHFIPFCH